MKEVSKQIQKNPNVEISCFDGNNRLCLAGRLVRDERKEAKKHMLDNYILFNSIEVKMFSGI